MMNVSALSDLGESARRRFRSVTDRKMRYRKVDPFQIRLGSLGRWRENGPVHLVISTSRIGHRGSTAVNVHLGCDWDENELTGPLEQAVTAPSDTVDGSGVWSPLSGVTANLPVGTVIRFDAPWERYLETLLRQAPAVLSIRGVHCPESPPTCPSARS